MRQNLILGLLLVFASCSGYRYTQTDNPLQQYGVDSLSVPMFYNFSSQPEVASNFTRETYKLLSGFSGLKLKSGWNQGTDAVLIGIVRSLDHMNEVLNTTTNRVAQDASPNAVGTDRPKFYIPAATRVSLSLQVIVVKRPTPEELSLLQSELGPKILPQGKIIFNETFNLSDSFNREIADGEATSVLGTQNAGVLRRTRENMAVQAAEQIRDMILYAF